jgi:hypothetical protein
MKPPLPMRPSEAPTASFRRRSGMTRTRLRRLPGIATNHLLSLSPLPQLPSTPWAVLGGRISNDGSVSQIEKPPRQEASTALPGHGREPRYNHRATPDGRSNPLRPFAFLGETTMTENSNTPAAVRIAEQAMRDGDCSGRCGDPDVSAGEFGEDVEGSAAVLGRGR